MGKRPKNKMTPEERAKQFSPFSALSGLELALLKKEKEKLKVAKKLASDDKAGEISRLLSEIKKGDIREITFYQNGEYVKQKGVIEKIDTFLRVLTLNEKEISFDDIFDITK